MIRKLLKSVTRICIVVFVLAILIVTGCINSIIFHPEMCSGGYRETTAGYVDIGTNGVRIAAVVRGPEHGKKAILRCHGNAENMVQTLWAVGELCADGYTVAAVDYPGYGLSDGSPNEKGCCRNVHRLYDWLVEARGFRPEDIIVDGFSVGTGPAVELAATQPVGGLILEAPFLSAPRVVTKVRILPIDPFPNLKRIGDVKCPVLFFHGTEDRVIPYSHGRALFELAREPKRFIAIEDGDHNDFPAVMGVDEYLREIRNFADSCGRQEGRDEVFRQGGQD